VAVSGGADSTALALLAHHWVSPRFGRVLALIVDHGLRPDSEPEAALTAARLAERGVDSKILTLRELKLGARLQERARAARYAVLAAACREAGAVFLLLGHHAADQSETVAMRAARGPHGLEAMPGWAARTDFLLLRPLLGTAPAYLRAYLRAHQMEWAEDSSNNNFAFERIRLRHAGAGAIAADPNGRRAMEHEIAAFLAAKVLLPPEGFAVIDAAAAPARAFGALIRAISGAPYAPDLTRTAALAAAFRPATLGGVMLRKSAKFGGAWLLAREPAACAAPVPAVSGAVWDGRFQLQAAAEGADLGALGDAAAQYRANTDLPAIVLRGLPCLRRGAHVTFPVNAQFRPMAPIVGHPFNA
jgi:tRNA(Ile)-lysidine synthase